MKTRFTLVAAAVALAFGQMPLTASAQTAKPAAPAAAPTPAKSPVTA